MPQSPANAILVQEGRPEPRDDISRSTRTEKPAPWLTRKRDLLFAFSIVSLPLLAITIIILVFVFEPDRHLHQIRSTDETNLPIPDQGFSKLYWTSHKSGPFLLLSSWASNIAAVVAAPFMMICSYVVAEEAIRNSSTDAREQEHVPHFFNEVLRGRAVALWQWGKYVFSDKKQQIPSRKTGRLGTINAAGVGLLTAGCLTLLVIIGDNWLHATTGGRSFTYYDPIHRDISEYMDPDIYSDPSVVIDITSCGPYLRNESQLPCSVNMTYDGLMNLADPENAYDVLLNGIAKYDPANNRARLTNLWDGSKSSDWQIVTFQDEDEIYHSIYFSASAAFEYYEDQSGYDFVAETFSMNTQCSIATNECKLKRTSNLTAVSDESGFSIPFSCYDGFSGDLSQTPSNGHENAQGWSLSFYSLHEGTPRNMQIQEQSNPFTFYAIAAVDSLSSDSYEYYHVNDTSSNELILVDGGRTAFALNCSATVYQVKYSLYNGTLLSFNHTVANSTVASIIRAPLQGGYGSFDLYEQAKSLILDYDPENRQVFLDEMAIAFSQTGMALANGPFVFQNNDISSTQARLRYTTRATAIQKAPFWFLISTSFLYAAVGTILTIVAFLLRRRPLVKQEQQRLMGLLISQEALEADETVEKVPREVIAPKAIFKGIKGFCRAPFKFVLSLFGN